MRSSRSHSLIPFAALLLLLVAGCARSAQQPSAKTQQPSVVTTTVAQPPEEASQPAAPAAEPATKPAAGGVKLDSDSGEKFGYLKKVWQDDGTVYLAVDYAEMLTGEAAAKAASAHGDESPPPNDYYIVNDNTKLRTFELSEDAAARYLIAGEPTLHDAAGASAYLATWKSSGPDAAVRMLPYKLWVSGTAVTKIEQVYLP